MGRDFLGTYDLFAYALLLLERGIQYRVTEPVRCKGLDDPQLAASVAERGARKVARGGRDGKGAVFAFRLRGLSRGS
jgi:hypothetical protein